MTLQNAHFNVLYALVTFNLKTIMTIINFTVVYRNGSIVCMYHVKITGIPNVTHIYIYTTEFNTFSIEVDNNTMNATINSKQLNDSLAQGMNVYVLLYFHR